MSTDLPPTGAPGATPPTPPTDQPHAASAGAPGGITLEDRNTAMLAHVGTLINVFTAIGGLFVPLVIYLLKKEENPFVTTEAKESLNFQITFFLANLAVFLISIPTCGFGALLYVVVFPVGLILPVIAGIKAKEGVHYRYPLTLRLVA